MTGEKVKELTKFHKNNEEKVATYNEHWRNGTTLIMGDSTVSRLMEKKCPKTEKLKLDFFQTSK